MILRCIARYNYNKHSSVIQIEHIVHLYAIGLNSWRSVADIHTISNEFIMKLMRHHVRVGDYKHGEAMSGGLQDWSHGK